MRVLQVRKKDLDIVFEFSFKKWKKDQLKCLGCKKILRKVRRGCNLKWMDWKNTPHLGWLELEAVTCKDISDLIGLLVLKLENCQMSRRQLCLDRLLNLQLLVIQGVKGIEEIMGLGSLVNLKSIALLGLQDLHKVDKFSKCLAQLQVVEIVGCDLLELDVEGLGLLPNLKALSFTHGCLCDFKEPLMFARSLQALGLYNVREEQPNLRDTGALEFLLMKYKGGRSVLGIHDLPRLKSMVLRGEVNEIAYVGQLPSLEHIGIHGCKGLKEIDWSSFRGLSNLKQVFIKKCPDLKNVKGDPSCIAHTLPLLSISDCQNLEKVTGLDMFTKYKLRNCKAIQTPTREGENSTLVG